ncbi:MAG: cytochrome c maturation protein CcmE [Devosia sp.]|nr:cytochrome c maturation protein CcmE [Devosia sp.]
MSTESATDRTAVRRRLGRKQKRLLIIAGVGLVLAVALGLILTALSNQITYFYTPSDAQAKHVAPGVAIRLGGLVMTGSWKKDGDNNTFVMSDGKGEMTAHFRGILPDLFREGQGVVAEGSIAADGSFTATNVLAKHDENYIPKEIVDDLKRRGEWRADDPQAALETMR